MAPQRHLRIGGCATGNRQGKMERWRFKFVLAKPHSPCRLVRRLSNSQVRSPQLTPAQISLIALGLILLWNLGSAYRRAVGMTLRAPLVWTALAITAILSVELGIDGSSPRASTWRYLAAVGTFCPPMALLGAKRPQDRGWQFVVGSLWIVLSLPALQAIVFAPSSPLELHPAWRWFLLLLVGVAVFNHLPTRYTLSALLAGAAQLLLLHEHTPIPWSDSNPLAVLTAIALLVIAERAVTFLKRRDDTSLTASNRVWLDFRDAFGAVWALRVVERVNQAAQQAGRADRLHWRGFPCTWDPLRGSSDGIQDPLQVTIRMLLRRFVSLDWIDQRCPQTDPKESVDRQL